MVVDISINRDIEGKLCGDMHKDATPMTKAYTPVPGGVGPMTINMLLTQTVASFRKKMEK